jgi:anti-sigma factor RsiW
MPCPDPQLVHAYVDSELDAQGAARIESHLAACADCESLRRQTQALRSRIGSEATYHRLAPARRAEILGELWRAAPPARTRRYLPPWTYWAGALSGIAAALLGVALLLPPREPGTAINDIVGAHLRSLLPDRLIDVESTDRHTVKPWFAGRVDASPPVADFAAEDYRLVGGRVDYVDGHRAAVVVYRHGRHLVNVFAWPGTRAALPAGTVTRNGYNLACWRSATVAYCAISDTGAEELLALTRLLQGIAVPDRVE